MSVNRFIEIIKQEVGYKEPEKGKSKYSNKSLSWSGDFIDWCADKAKISIPQFSDIESQFKKLDNENLLLKIQNNKIGPQTGDIVFFSFPGTDKTNEVKHVGVCLKNLGNGIVSTVEGNTCDNSKDNQREGGMVVKKIRAWTKHNYKKIPMSIVGWYTPESILADTVAEVITEKLEDKPVIKKPRKKAVKKAADPNTTSSRMIRKGE